MENLDHILIVDDDPDIRELLSQYLLKNGLKVSTAANGKQLRVLLDANASTTFDLIVLDLMMPGEDGLTLCRDLRANGVCTIPILMLTAKNEESDRILGLEMGADDYLTKPFASRELLARVRAILRRSRMLPANLRAQESTHLFAFGHWRLDTIARHLLDNSDTIVALSGAEYRLLRVFLDHRQRVLSRDQLLNLTQGRDADPFDRSIDILVSRLRKRLSEENTETTSTERNDMAYIKTIRNEGYVFAAAITEIKPQ
ncbi:MAG: response regulator [Cytophaga sp.]|nr:response regulator [Undibacterium sp.]